VRREFQPKETAIGAHDKVEVKVGSESIIVEQSELDDLIEALSEMRNLAADGRAMMNIGSA
jgi:hypothetical protein